MMWGSRRKQQQEEDRKQVAQLQERITQLENKVSESLESNAKSKVSRRVSLLIAGGGLLFAALTFFRNTPGSDLKISSEIFDKDSLGGKPAGIRFTIRNNGDRIAVFKKIRIVIEDYVRVESCFYGSGPIDIDSCYGVTLPVNPESEMALEVSIRYEITTDEAGSFDLALLEESGHEVLWPSANNTPYGNMYRLHVQLVQDDGSVNDAGRFIVDGYIRGTYWQANETYDPNSGGRITREESAKGFRPDWEAVIACIEGNESELKKLVTPDAEMTPKIRRMWEGMRSGTETYQMPTAPSTDTITCNE